MRYQEKFDDALTAWGAASLYSFLVTHGDMQAWEWRWWIGHRGLDVGLGSAE